MTTGPTRKIEMTKILIEIDPETHMLVPIEPTEEMFAAANKIDDEMYCGGSQHGADIDQVYYAMIDAAPQPEPVDVGSVGWKHDCAALCANDIELWIDRCPHCGKPRHNHPPTDDEYMPECVTALYTTPKPDRTAELEAALKVARDGIDEFLVANDPTKFGCACDLSVGYLCGPCHADMQQEPLKIALAKINEVLHD